MYTDKKKVNDAILALIEDIGLGENGYMKWQTWEILSGYLIDGELTADEAKKALEDLWSDSENVCQLISALSLAGAIKGADAVDEKFAPDIRGIVSYSILVGRTMEIFATKLNAKDSIKKHEITDLIRWAISQEADV